MERKIVLIIIMLIGCVAISGGLSQTKGFNEMEENIGNTHTLVGYIGFISKVMDYNYQGQIYDIPLETEYQVYVPSGAKVVYLEFSPSVDVSELNTNTLCEVKGRVDSSTLTLKCVSNLISTFIFSGLTSLFFLFIFSST